ncbi:hypothetical protein B0T25DRAFT_443701, partial [Lasiosphaeria hispida]
SLADQIIRLIINTRDRDQQIPSFHFPWPPDQVESIFSKLFLQLDRIGLRNAARFEYDYQSHTALLDMSESGETKSHSLIGWMVTSILDKGIQRAALDINNVAIQKMVKWITCFNTAAIRYKGKLFKLPDGSESWPKVEKKAKDYIRQSNGEICVVFIINAHYPHLKKATVSLLVADGGGGFHWNLSREVIHDDRLQHQPSGEVNFYLSDFLGSEGLPINFCRPPTGISRSPYFTVSYQRLAAVFRTARHVRHPDVFAMAEEDLETNLFEEMQQEHERRIAEERSEAERRIAEERSEAERRIAKERSKAERRIAEERRQREQSDKRAAKDRRRLKRAERRLERVLAEAESRATEEHCQREESDKHAPKHCRAKRSKRRTTKAKR